MIRFFGSSTCFEQLCAHPQVDGQLYEYNFWYNHSVLVAVRYIGRPLTQSNYTRRCIKLLKPTGHVMHSQFNIQQLYALPTLYLCVLYLSENKQRLVPLTAETD